MNPDVPTGDFALFLDVDGTLIDIAPHPDSVIVAPGLVDDLRGINRMLGGALALVSGRTIANLDALFAPLKLRASGVHGAEFRYQPGESAIVPGAPALPEIVWTDLLGLIGVFPGTMAENKAYSIAVHYRSAPLLRAPLLASLEKFVEERADLNLRIMAGHSVFEVKRADFNKGIAVEAFLERNEFRGRTPIFIGDDITDWPGFAAARKHQGLAYSVGTVVPEVSGIFPDPTSVRYWLRQIILSETVSA